MNIIEKVKNKCAEGVYNIAMSKYKDGSGTLCLYLTYCETDFIEELILDEE